MKSIGTLCFLWAVLFAVLHYAEYLHNSHLYFLTDVAIPLFSGLLLLALSIDLQPKKIEESDSAEKPKT